MPNVASPPGSSGLIKHRWRAGGCGHWTAIDPGENRPVEDTIEVWCYQRVIDIHWDVVNVSQRAVDVTLAWLRTKSAERPGVTALKFRYGAWATEVYDSPEQAASRIEEIDQFRSSVPYIGTMRKRLTLYRAYDGRPDTVSMVDTWLRLGGILDPAKSETLIRLLPKTLIFRYIANDNSFIYALAGRNSMASRVIGLDSWSESVLGRRAEDCWSDDTYEHDVCADYGPVIERDEGQYHHFHAVVNLPGRGSVWCNYERLMLPWETPNGGRVLMVLAMESQNLDIPILTTGT